MKDLLNFLVGLGESVNALGTAPAYHRPRMGDRAQDIERIAGDLRAVGSNLRETTEQAVREQKGGKVNDHANQR